MTGPSVFTGTSKLLKPSKFAGVDEAGLIPEAPALNNVLLSFNTYPAR
jgi:hypothetical protein